MKLAEILKPNFRFYLDLDGVLNDFEAEVEKHLGKDWKNLHPAIFWRKLSLNPPHLFLNSQPLPDAFELVQYLEQFDFSCLGSLPLKTGVLKTAEQDKREWLLKHFNITRADFVYGGRKKAKFANSKYDVLIDDTICNIEAWEKAGGTAILHTSAADTIKKLNILQKR
jgi:5'(3')-deoxyribonucleotidase